MNHKIFLLLFLIACPSWAAINFDGVDDHVGIASMPIASTTKLTCSFWFKTTQNVATAFNLIDFRDTTVGVTSGFEVYLFSGFTSTLLNHTIGIDSLWLVADGVWHCMVFTQDQTLGSNNFKCYIDNVLMAQKTYTSVLAGSVLSPQFACRFSTTAFFAGMLEDIRYYNRVLDLNETESLFRSRMRLNITDGLVGWWPLDEGNDAANASGATVLDRCNAPHNGLAAGGAGITWRASEFVNYVPGDD
jgi:hypothetical protein